MKKLTGIYKITCTATGQVYIGASKDISARFSGHKSLLRNNKHENRALQKCCNEHGINSLVLEVLEECAYEVEIIVSLENKYMQEYKGKLFNKNISNKGRFGPLSEETTKRIEERKALDKRKWDLELLEHKIREEEALKRKELGLKKRMEKINMKLDYSLGI